MKLLIAALAVALTSFTFDTPPASADAGLICPGDGDLGGVHEACVAQASRTFAYIAEHSDHTFSVAEACATDNATCPRAPSCVDGLVYNIWEDQQLLPWQACLTPGQAAQINGLTPGFVERAFKRLTWPASELVIQPPDGKTLVNFDTNFYTTNTDPTTQTVTLLGQQVTVEATPTQYTWHFGAAADTPDTADDLTTTDAGAPYPDLRVTHRYTRVGTVRPSLDTTYSGRYRVGAGAWQTIPDTLTVPGQPVTLQVVSATPHLVGY